MTKSFGPKVWQSTDFNGSKTKPAHYSAFHKNVARKRGKPQKREDRGTADAAKRYHWANLTGNCHDARDYRRLCALCHRRFDIGLGKIGGRPKLNHELVRQIRSETMATNYQTLAKRYGVSKDTIAGVCSYSTRAPGGKPSGWKPLRRQQRLTAKQVLRIRSDVAMGTPQNRLAAQFKVSTSLIQAIVKRRVWKTP